MATQRTDHTGRLQSRGERFCPQKFHSERNWSAPCQAEAGEGRHVLQGLPHPGVLQHWPGECRPNATQGAGWPQEISILRLGSK